MPEPLHPPFSAGAQAIPRQLNRWLDVNPQGGQLTRTQSYITFPAFTQAVSWLGYSEIVCSFNFEGPNNFSLKSFSGLPISPNYALAISYIDSSNVMHRYWLWTGAGEVIYFQQTLYTGQPIGKNFRFEVWSTNNTPAEQLDALQFYTSVRGSYDYRFQTDATLVEDDGQQTAFTASLQTITSPPPGFISNFRSDTLYNRIVTPATWTSTVNPTDVLTSGTFKPSINSFDTFYSLNLSTNAYLTGTIVGSANASVFLVFTADSGAGGAAFTIDSTTVDISAVVSGLCTLTIPSFTGAATLIYAHRYLIEFRDGYTIVFPLTPTGNNDAQVLSATSYAPISGSSFSLGGAINPITLFEIITYPIKFTTINQYQKLWSYISSRYDAKGLFSVPLIFPAGSTSTQNI